MTDKEVEAISDFLRHFGSFACWQISVRRVEPKPRTQADVGRFVLDTLATWRAEGLDAARLYHVATIAIHFEAYELPGELCMPACCRPWGELAPACPPGPGRPLTGAQLQQATLRAVPIGPPPAPDAPLPDDLDEDLKRTGLSRSRSERPMVITSLMEAGRALAFVLGVNLLGLGIAAHGAAAWPACYWGVPGPVGPADQRQSGPRRSAERAWSWRADTHPRS